MSLSKTGLLIALGCMALVSSPQGFAQVDGTFTESESPVSEDIGDEDLAAILPPSDAVPASDQAGDTADDGPSDVDSGDPIEDTADSEQDGAWAQASGEEDLETDVEATDVAQATGPVYALEQAGVADESTAGVTGTHVADVLSGDAGEQSPFWMNYFSILYGPALKNPSSYQPTPLGTADPDRPVLIRNQLSVGVDLSDQLLIGATLPFTWIPVQGHRLELRDPYLRLGVDHILQSETLNYYADLRVHFPVTKESRNQDMLASIQTFQILTLLPSAQSDFSLDLYGSAKANFFGRRGSGADLELYFAPQLNYQVASTVAFTLLYEAGFSHWFGDRPWLFYSEGSDIEPGISWDVTPNLNLHPYMNIFPTGKVNWQSTSIGLMMNFKLL